MLDHSSQILKFYDYGAQIVTWHNVYNPLDNAAKDVNRHASDEVMAWWERLYGSIDVRLLLHPGPSMTWGMWMEGGNQRYIRVSDALPVPGYEL